MCIFLCCKLRTSCQQFVQLQALLSVIFLINKDSIVLIKNTLEENLWMHYTVHYGEYTLLKGSHESSMAHRITTE